MFIVISYDIKDDKRRSKIFKVLKNFGQWMQFSVFECELDKANFLRLKDRLDHLIDALGRVNDIFLAGALEDAVLYGPIQREGKQ